MANVRKSVENNQDNNVETISNVNEQSYEELKKENEELKSEFAKMNEKMTNLMEQMLKLSTNSSIEKNSDSNREVTVYNMTVGKLILSTTGKSDGKIYKFNEQFESQPILFNDLKEICRTMKSFAQGGKFFIDDEEAVKEIGLVSSYREVLSKNILENIFSLDSTEFVNEYNRVNKAQKAIIESMVAIKCMMGEEIDANILRALSKVTGRDYLTIEPLPEEYLNRE